MVADNPESFADLDGHLGSEFVDPHRTGLDVSTAFQYTDPGLLTESQIQAASQNQAQGQTQDRTQDLQVPGTLVVVPNPSKPLIARDGSLAIQFVDYTLGTMDSKGNVTAVKDDKAKVELDEKLVGGNKNTQICTPGACVRKGFFPDGMSASANGGPHSVEKRFQVNDKATPIYDPGTKKAYNFVRVDASPRKGFVFNYGNDPN